MNEKSSMSANGMTELLPCPFCGWTSEKDHADGCYFSVSDQLRAAAPADLSLVPEVLAAWNRRATPTAEPGTSVPVPQNSDQAQLMANLGLGYLKDHAPERLRAEPVQGVSDAEDAARYQETMRQNRIGEAVAHWKLSWPEQLSNVMFFNGARITRAEFEELADRVVARSAQGNGGEG